MCVVTLHFHSSSMLSPLYRWRNWGKEELSNFLNISLLIRGWSYAAGQKADHTISRERFHLIERLENLSAYNTVLWTQPWGVNRMSRQTQEERLKRKVAAQVKIGKRRRYISSLLDLVFLLLVGLFIASLLAFAQLILLPETNKHSLITHVFIECPLVLSLIFHLT